MFRVENSTGERVFRKNIISIESAKSSARFWFEKTGKSVFVVDEVTGRMRDWIW